MAPCRPMLSRANPVSPWALIPAATAANPPSSTYWAADAAASRARAAAGHRLPAEAAARREGHGPGRGALPGRRYRVRRYP